MGLLHIMFRYGCPGPEVDQVQASGAITWGIPIRRPAAVRRSGPALNTPPNTFHRQFRGWMISRVPSQ
jgi:hypothetical protein